MTDNKKDEHKHLLEALDLLNKVKGKLTLAYADALSEELNISVKKLVKIDLASAAVLNSVRNRKDIVSIISVIDKLENGPIHKIERIISGLH